MPDQTLTYAERPWPEGPWMNEPDRVLWTDPDTGLDCMVRRHDRSGHLCGYVAVPAGHPAHGQSYYHWDDDEEYTPVQRAINGINVHGGLTYAEPCDGDQEAGICHIPRPGESDDAWWFGFDCAHHMDQSPGNTSYAHLIHRYPGEVYRTVEYVRGECTSLARQLAAVQS